jgi:5-methylcytosine-specific restriction endonuclease McrA
LYFFLSIYSLLKIAQGEEHNFVELVSKIKPTHLFKNGNDRISREKISDEHKKIKISIDETKFVRAGMRWQVFERDDFKCVACGRSAKDGAILHVDHIVPRSKGGKNEMDNYQTLCHLCNIGKSNKSQTNLRGGKRHEF